MEYREERLRAYGLGSQCFLHSSCKTTQRLFSETHCSFTAFVRQGDELAARIEQLHGKLGVFPTALQAEASLSIRYRPLPQKLQELELIVASDASFGNIENGTASQAGHVIALGSRAEFEKSGESYVTVLYWRSHKRRREEKEEEEEKAVDSDEARIHHELDKM